MASEKIIGMMVEKGAPFSVEQLKAMEDRECWRWIYANFPPKAKRPAPSKPEICFTGFRPDDRTRLERLAKQNGYHVVTDVTVRLKVLVTGEAPGPVKLKKARQQEAEILSEAEFLARIPASAPGQPCCSA
jgi:BRCT domain type II-containing protein